MEDYDASDKASENVVPPSGYNGATAAPKIETPNVQPSVQRRQKVHSFDRE